MSFKHLYLLNIFVFLTLICHRYMSLIFCFFTFLLTQLVIIVQKMTPHIKASNSIIFPLSKTARPAKYNILFFPGQALHYPYQPYHAFPYEKYLHTCYIIT